MRVHVCVCMCVCVCVCACRRGGGGGPSKIWVCKINVENSVLFLFHSHYCLQAFLFDFNCIILKQDCASTIQHILFAMEGYHHHN